MSSIIAVSGPFGGGKTHWIQAQIEKNADSSVSYFSPQTESIPIDSIRIGTQFPNVQIVMPPEAPKITDITYVEIPWYVDLLSIEEQLQQLDCQRVAILPDNNQLTPWHDWAQLVIPGNGVLHSKGVEVHRVLLQGEVIDFPSLEVFWYELTRCAYGDVFRVKGIFDIMDGQSVYGEFMDTIPISDWEALNLPLWLEGRPQRFSGLEIVGRNLQREEIAATVRDCCLSESAIANYQKQVQSVLAMEEVEVNP